MTLFQTQMYGVQCECNGAITALRTKLPRICALSHDPAHPRHAIVCIVSPRPRRGFCMVPIATSRRHVSFSGPAADRIGRFTFRGTCPTVGTTFGYIYIQAQIYGCGRSLQHIFRTPNSKVTHILAKICRTRPKLNAASLTLSHASTCHSHVGAMTGNHQRDALVVLDVAVRLVQDIPRVEDRPRPALLSLMWHFTVRNTC